MTKCSDDNCCCIALTSSASGLGEGGGEGGEEGEGGWSNGEG